MMGLLFGKGNMENNTYIEIECKDGNRIKLTLAFYRMYQLKNKNKQIYEKCNKILTKGSEDILDNIQILYAAYLCANIETMDKCMAYEEFLQNIPDDWNMVGKIAKQLVGVKKKKDLEKHF